METLQSHLSRIRHLKAKGADFEFAAMKAILRLRSLSVLWRAAKSDTFEDFLKRERLCTMPRLASFEKALDAFGEGKVRTMGVEAACLLARQKKTDIAAYEGTVLNFSREFGSGPTYQFVTTLVGRKRKKSGPSRQDLLRYIDTLKNEIRQLGGRIPTPNFANAA